MKKHILLLTLGLSCGLVNAQFSIQKAVLEEFTGAWCQYCPDGAVIAEQIDQNQANAIVYAVHSGDAMEVTVGTDMASFYNPAFPEALINRAGALVSRGQWNSTVQGELTGAGVVTVALDSITYDVQTRELGVTVKATFTGPASGDMRFNLVLFEDHITGTGSGYNQVNAFNNTAGHPYYQAGNPIVGFDHRHVLRTMLSGAWGEAGIIPSTANFGTSASKRYTYTLPANWKDYDVTIAGLVQRYDGAGIGDREILNAEEFHLSPLIISNDVPALGQAPVMHLSPNPSSGVTKVAFEIHEAGMIRMEVLNTLGQHVADLGSGYMNEGMHTLAWNGADAAGRPVRNGVYLIRLITENGQSATQRLMLAR